MYIGMTRSPFVVILLSIVTCGIYALFWYYTIMKDLNLALGEERINPVLFLVLGILCGPVFWYVLYVMDKGLLEIARNEGVNYSENFILWLLLTFIFGIGSFVAMYQITCAYNEIWARRNGGVDYDPQRQ